MKPIENTAVKTWKRGVSSALLGTALWLAAQPAAGQLFLDSSGTVSSTTSTLTSTTSDTTSSLTSTTTDTTSTVTDTTSSLTSTTSSLLSLPPDLSGLTATLSSPSLTLVDRDTVTGTLTITNTTPAQSLQISSIALVMDLIGSGGTSAVCREVSFLSNVAPGTVLAVGQSLPVSFTAVCTNSTPPLDLHEIMNLLVVTFVGSNTVWTSSALSHL